FGVRKNETIIYHFINQSYASITGEDWIGAFTWPNCKGYDDYPFDHSTNSMIIRTTASKEAKEFDRDFYKGECQKRHHKIMQYVDKFLDDYNGISKFAIVWFSRISHDSLNGLYHLDRYFADFFRKHVNNLNNSFVFMMGDHGLRFGKVRKTSVGGDEDNNPLFVALPKSLRSNEQLVVNLKKNSRRHTSHFDFYATLYDIAQYSSQNHFTNWGEHNFRGELGEVRGGIRAKSILRPISYDRTCKEMEIKTEYCICKEFWRNISAKVKNVEEAAQFIISMINNYLEQKNSSEVCEKLHLIKVISAKSVVRKPILKLVITASPSIGSYEAQVLTQKHGFRLISQVTRVDSYGSQGDCAMDEEIRPLCYCRKNYGK
ncbi:unnamed protein product, partial [Thelazia callipaeda]|uniref:Sulfatase domain-containing protein n=1 Tax=Thelazia callipaeda TaxID=103827 RepID=A0A0N5DAW2_THECL